MYNEMRARENDDFSHSADLRLQGVADGMRAILSYFTRGAHLPKFRERGFPGEPNYSMEQRSFPHEWPTLIRLRLLISRLRFFFSRIVGRLIDI